MAQFKAGDTVRRVKCTNGSAARVGQIATVVHTNNPGFVSVRYDGYVPDLADSTVESWISSYVELIEEHRANKPHKHKDLIIAWANGAEIQVYSPLCVGWVDCLYPVWHESDIYRVKPSTIKYRNFLWQFSSDTPAMMHVVEFNDNVVEDRATWKGFIRWVGDWQEVEV